MKKIQNVTVMCGTTKDVDGYDEHGQPLIYQVFAQHPADGGASGPEGSAGPGGPGGSQNPSKGGSSGGSGGASGQPGQIAFPLPAPEGGIGAQIERGNESGDPDESQRDPAGIYISGYVARRLDASPHARALVWQAPEITGRYVSVELPEDFRTSQGMFFIGLQDVQPGETWPGLEGLEGGLTEPNP